MIKCFKDTRTNGNTKSLINVSTAAAFHSYPFAFRFNLIVKKYLEQSALLWTNWELVKIFLFITNINVKIAFFVFCLWDFFVCIFFCINLILGSIIIIKTLFLTISWSWNYFYLLHLFFLLCHYSVQQIKLSSYLSMTNQSAANTIKFNFTVDYVCCVWFPRNALSVVNFSQRSLRRRNAVAHSTQCDESAILGPYYLYVIIINQCFI